jgi:hypothetical protein
MIELGGGGTWKDPSYEFSFFSFKDCSKQNGFIFILQHCSQIGSPMSTTFVFSKIWIIIYVQYILVHMITQIKSLWYK